MSSHQMLSNQSLSMVINRAIYPVTKELLHCLFDPYSVEQVVVYPPIIAEDGDPCVAADVRFSSDRAAAQAYADWDGRCIYYRCCCLQMWSASSDVLPAQPLAATTRAAAPVPHGDNNDPTASTPSDCFGHDISTPDLDTASCVKGPVMASSDTAGCVTEPATASSGTAELVTASDITGYITGPVMASSDTTEIMPAPAFSSPDHDTFFPYRGVTTVELLREGVPEPVLMSAVLQGSSSLVSIVKETLGIDPSVCTGFITTAPATCSTDCLPWPSFKEIIGCEFPSDANGDGTRPLPWPSFGEVNGVVSTETASDVDGGERGASADDNSVHAIPCSVVPVRTITAGNHDGSMPTPTASIRCSTYCATAVLFPASPPEASIILQGQCKYDTVHLVNIFSIGLKSLNDMEIFWKSFLDQNNAHLNCYTLAYFLATIRSCSGYKLLALAADWYVEERIVNKVFSGMLSADEHQMSACLNAEHPIQIQAVLLQLSITYSVLRIPLSGSAIIYVVAVSLEDGNAAAYLNLHAVCIELVGKNEQPNYITADSCELVGVDFSGQEDSIVTIGGNICQEDAYLLCNFEQQQANDIEWYFPCVCGPANSYSISVLCDEWVLPLWDSRQHVPYDQLSCAIQNASYWSGNLVTSGQIQVTTACSTWQLFLSGSSPSLIKVKSLVWTKEQYGILLYVAESTGAKLTHEFGNWWNYMENLQLLILIQASEQEPIPNGFQFQRYMALYLAQGLFFFDAPTMRSRFLCMWQAHGILHASQLQRDNMALVFSCGLIPVGKLSRNWNFAHSAIGRRALIILIQSVALKYMTFWWFTTAIWTEFASIFNNGFSLQFDATCSVQPFLWLTHAYQLSVLAPTVFSLAWGNLACNSNSGTTIICWVPVAIDGEANQHGSSLWDPGGSTLALCSCEKCWTALEHIFLHRSDQLRWISLVFAYASRIWLVTWAENVLEFSAGYSYGQVHSQGGRNVKDQAAFSNQDHVGHDYYIAYINEIFVGYGNYLDTIYKDLSCYHEDNRSDSNKMKEFKAPWDPGKSVFRYPLKTSAWGQAEFQGGRDVRTLASVPVGGLLSRAGTDGPDPSISIATYTQQAATKRASKMDQELGTGGSLPPT